MILSFFDLFQRGGPVMWPILLLSIVALAIVLERLFLFSQVESDSSHLLKAVLKALENRQLAHAHRLCDQSNGPLGRVLKAGIQNYGRTRGEIREAMEESVSLEIRPLERYVPLLGTIAHLAPLLGLLGTVTGLIRCFQVIQEKATSVNPVNPGDLAGGIWEALLTTVFGLLVAIPAYAMYHYLVHRINGFLHELESSCLRLLPLLSGEESAVVLKEIHAAKA